MEGLSSSNPICIRFSSLYFCELVTLELCPLVDAPSWDRWDGVVGDGPQSCQCLPVDINEVGEGEGLFGFQIEADAGWVLEDDAGIFCMHSVPSDDGVHCFLLLTVVFGQATASNHRLLAVSIERYRQKFRIVDGYFGLCFAGLYLVGW